MVVAATQENGIGLDGAMPWSLSEDMVRFKQLTCSGKKMNTLIMGRRTWMSLPKRPLPGRRNVVVTSEPVLDGCDTAPSLAAALAMADPEAKTFVIGGARLFDQALAHPDCDRVHLTRIKAHIPCDTHFLGVSDGRVLLPGGVDRDACTFETWVKPIRLIIDPTRPVVLVDASYMVFHRYNATLRWYTYREPNIDHANITADAVFIQAFLRHLDKDLAKFKADKGNVIFCRDCKRAEIWRMKLFPAYKSGRVHASSFNAGIFPIFYEHIARDYQTVRMAELEGDDVAALLAQLIPSEVVFVTNDNDYLQLCGPGRTVKNLSGGAIEKRSCGCPTKDLLIKVLMGDKSDNIPPAFAKCGKKTAKAMAELPEAERWALLTKKGALEAFERNRKLVDLALIPDDLVAKFRATVQIENKK